MKAKADRSVPYADVLGPLLGDPAQAAAYLSAALADGAPGVFLLALRDVAEAHGGMSEFARKCGLNRENLYRMLSAGGNPALSSLTALLAALGLQLEVKPAQMPGRRRRSKPAA